MTPKINFTYIDDNGYEVDAELPAYYIVCPRCKGNGVHDHLSFKGFTQEDFGGDPDFMEDYMRGVYDVVCTKCAGKRVVAVLDDTNADPDLVKRYNDIQQQLAEVEAIQRAEMRYCYGPDY